MPAPEPADAPFSYTMARFLPFHDAAACARVRAIPETRLAEHPNPDFRIRVIEDPAAFYQAFALDMVGRIARARDAGRRFVGIFPVGPMPQYPIAARMINALGITLHHVHTFNMDEYADQDGRTAPASWVGSFQNAMMDGFVAAIRPELRPPLEQIHFPTTAALPGYAEAIDRLGGADVCYGGIGWSGHIAFWEPHLAAEFGDDLAAFRRAGPRCVELHPMTIMQNALHSFSGDWSWVPPKANTIGPEQVLGARDRSFWLDGDLGGASWQRFIARLVAHGPVTPAVPGSILQTVPGTYTILGAVARNVEVAMA
jgi:glucosamine-6-phosphate deaminase